MALTRRLDDFTEVRAAFLFCIRHKRILEAIFWLQELEDSLYGGEARRLLFLSWFMNVGIRKLSWLAEWSIQSTTREGRLELCWKLVRCTEKDSSLWWLMWSGALCSAPTGKLTSGWKSVAFVEDPTEFWEPIVNGSDDERVDCILEALQEDMRSYTIFARCAGFAIAQTVRQLPKSTWVVSSAQEPAIIQESLISWKSLSNIQEKRVYEIPYDCLFGMTWRGAGGDTSLQLLELGLTEFTASPYWKKTVSATWKSDDELEIFWDTHFAGCDIPDEWSRSAREKSHGSGCPVGPLGRWWSRWICSERLYTYGIDHYAVRDWVHTQKTTVSVIDRLLQLYKEPPTQSAQLASLNTDISVKKEWFFQQAVAVA